MKIIVDSREQLPFRFDRFDCETLRSALPVGDYSIKGQESRAAIERKNGIDELVACLTHDRERFERELKRASDYALFAVVVEGRFEDLATGRFRSRMTSKAAVASLAAFTVRYCPFLFCGTRSAAELMTYELLAKFTREESNQSVKGV